MARRDPKDMPVGQRRMMLGVALLLGVVLVVVGVSAEAPLAILAGVVFAVIALVQLWKTR